MNWRVMTSPMQPSSNVRYHFEYPIQDLSRVRGFITNPLDCEDVEEAIVNVTRRDGAILSMTSTTYLPGSVVYVRFRKKPERAVILLETPQVCR